MTSLREGWRLEKLGESKVTVTFKVTVTCVLDEESAKILKKIKGML